MMSMIDNKKILWTLLINIKKVFSLFNSERKANVYQQINAAFYNYQ